MTTSIQTSSTKLREETTEAANVAPSFQHLQKCGTEDERLQKLEETIAQLTIELQKTKEELGWHVQEVQSYKCLYNEIFKRVHMLEQISGNLLMMSSNNNNGNSTKSYLKVGVSSNNNNSIVTHHSVDSNLHNTTAYSSLSQDNRISSPFDTPAPDGKVPKPVSKSAQVFSNTTSKSAISHNTRAPATQKQSTAYANSAPRKTISNETRLDSTTAPPKMTSGVAVRSHSVPISNANGTSTPVLPSRHSSSPHPTYSVHHVADPTPPSLLSSEYVTPLTSSSPSLDDPLRMYALTHGCTVVSTASPPSHHHTAYHTPTSNALSSSSSSSASFSAAAAAATTLQSTMAHSRPAVKSATKQHQQRNNTSTAATTATTSLLATKHVVVLSPDRKRIDDNNGGGHPYLSYISSSSPPPTISYSPEICRVMVQSSSSSGGSSSNTIEHACPQDLSEQEYLSDANIYF
jgi:hypothetical protein